MEETTQSMQVYTFADQTVDPEASLHELYSISTNWPLVSDFLEKSRLRYLEAIRELPQHERITLSCESFLDLAAKCSDVRRLRQNAVTASVLTCVAQIGWAIVLKEEHNYLCDPEIPIASFGVCIGQLAAIVCSATKSAVHLTKIGPDVVILALRLGLTVHRKALSIEDGSGEWSRAIRGLSSDGAKQRVLNFNQKQEIPAHRQVYVSAYTSKSTTISGPPTSLDLFQDEEFSRTHSATNLPIYGPYHAGHLTWPCVKGIVGSSELLSVKLSKAILLVGNGERIDVGPEDTIGSIFQKVVRNLLSTPIDMDQVKYSFKTLVEERQSRVIFVGPYVTLSIFEPKTQSLASRCIGSGLEEHYFESEASKSIGNGGIDDNAVAIVGMAGKFPGAENPDELWHLLEGGKDMHREIPIERFNIQTHWDPTGHKRNTTLTPYACIYEHADLFDLNLFKMSPREAAQTDPMQRLMLITAYEALESAGYSEAAVSIKARVGTYYGQGGDDWRQVNSSQDIDSKYITGGIRAFGPGRVSYHFGFEGPSMTVDTACSSSAVAIDLACTQLQLGICDMALAGGANILTASDMFAGLSRAGFLSLSGGCKTWDETADGYCRADAVATVVLKRLKDAVQSQDKILGVIRSSGTNHAPDAISITHPHSETQEKLLQEVLRKAKLRPNDIDHVETHGTGTQAGDVAEIHSIARVFGERSGKRRLPLTVGAVKPNVGHSEAASGVTSLIKCLLMFQHNMIPRHIGIRGRINPALPPLESLSIKVPFENLPLQKAERARRMVVSNFNATGGSTAIVLEESRTTLREASMEASNLRSHYVITLSGASKNSLRENIKRLLDFIERRPQTKIADLSYSLTARRMHHNFRLSCNAPSSGALMSELRTMVLKASEANPQGTPALIFVCTGQASSYMGMGKELFETCATFRNHILWSDSLCVSMGLPSFASIIQTLATNPQDYNTVQWHLALVALEIALAALLESWGLSPVATVGHSLGEYSALCISKVLSISDTLYLVGKRAEAIVSSCDLKSFGMVAVSATVAFVLEVIAQLGFTSCSIACLNGPSMTVVSGPLSDISRLASSVREKGINVVELNLPYGFHSSHMDAVLSKIGNLGSKVMFGKPSIPVASSLLARVVPSGDVGTFNGEYLTKQTREAVNFMGALQALKEDETSERPYLWLELGPRASCLPMIRMTLGSSHSHLVSLVEPKEKPWQSISKAMAKIYEAGIDPDWLSYHSEYRQSLTFMKLPSYCFDMTSHWIQYDGDWAIRKNQPVETPMPNGDVVSILHLNHSSLEREGGERGATHLLFRYNLARLTLQDMACAHLKSVQPLCTAYQYASMAVSAAIEAWQIMGLDHIASPAIRDLKLTHPLLMRVESHSQHVDICVIHYKDDNTVKISFFSTPGLERIIHAECLIADADDSLLARNDLTYLFNHRIQSLIHDLRIRKNQFSKRMIYKMLPQYDHPLQAMEEIVFPEDSNEAVASIKLPNTAPDPGPPLDTHWLEILTQPCVMLMDAKNLNLPENVYLCQGWKSLRLTNIDPNKECQVYVQMEPCEPTKSVMANLRILQNQQVVGIIEGIRYQAGDNSSTGLPPFSGNVKKNKGQTAQTRVADQPHTSSGSQQSSTKPSSEHPSPPTSAVQSSRTSSISTPPPPISKPDASPSAEEILLHIISTELGVSSSAVASANDFADLGLDSILTMAVSSRYLAETETKLPAGFLIKYSSMMKIRAYFAA